MKQEFIDLLHSGSYSCVISNNDKTRTFTRSGVIDMYELLRDNDAFMVGASVADKVVGKGAAALFVLGRIHDLYTDVVSTPALKILKKASIEVTFGEEVPHIINRAGTDMCPLEMRTQATDNPHEILSIVTRFLSDMKKKTNE